MASTDVTGLLLGAGFYLILLASGVWAFGSRMGSAVRGACVPLLLVPLATDWIRFVTNLPFKSSWLLAMGLYAAAALASYLGLKAGRRNLFHWQGGVNWKLLLTLLFLHILIRTWLFTGSLPNPADDNYGGYKANALFHAQGWAAPHPEAPEITYNYYYYIYSWPAALASWLGVNLWVGWWLTCVVMCVMGSLLMIGILRAPTGGWLSCLTTGILVTAGASFFLILVPIYHVPPKGWAYILSSQCPADLYIRIPEMNRCFWAPFAMLTLGTLLNALYLLVQQWRRGVSPQRFAFVVLAVASLAGYCTLNLVGFSLVIAPILLWLLVRKLRADLRLNALMQFVVLGLFSAIATLPLLLEFIQRDKSFSLDAPRKLLLPWLADAPANHGTMFIAGFFLLILLHLVVNNPLGLWGLFRNKASRNPLFISLCTGIFIFGSIACVLGVTSDFPMKFGTFTVLCGAVLFFHEKPFGRWKWAFYFIALIGPALILCNNVRANISGAKPTVWRRVLDTASEQGRIPVYYPNPIKGWTEWSDISCYFSRAQFFVDVDHIDGTGRQFMKTQNYGYVQNLPVEERILHLYPEAQYYLQLSRADEAAPVGEIIYQDEKLQLRKVRLNKAR